MDGPKAQRQISFVSHTDVAQPISPQQALLINLLPALRAPAPASRFSPARCGGLPFFDYVAVAIVIESICDRVDSNSWTVPTSRQFVDTEHRSGPQIPISGLPMIRELMGDKGVCGY